MRAHAILGLAGLVALVTARPMNITPSSLIARNPTAVRPQNAPFGRIITKCARPGTVALTFDDGPGPYADELLDILTASNAKATFFVNGDNGPLKITNQSASNALRRAFDAGHQIASHTWSHPDLQLLTKEEQFDEMTKLENALLDIIGVTPTYFRSPFTSCNSTCVSDMTSWGYHVVDYNIDTKDYTGDYEGAREIFSNTIAQPVTNDTPGYIVLSHDTHADTVFSLTPYMIREAEHWGYELVTVGDCLGDPPENWYRMPAYRPVFPDDPDVEFATSNISTNSISTGRKPFTNAAVETANLTSSHPTLPRFRPRPHPRSPPYSEAERQQAVETAVFFAKLLAILTGSTVISIWVCLGLERITRLRRHTRWGQGSGRSNVTGPWARAQTPPPDYEDLVGRPATTAVEARRVPGSNSSVPTSPSIMMVDMSWVLGPDNRSRQGQEEQADGEVRSRSWRSSWWSRLLK